MGAWRILAHRTGRATGVPAHRTRRRPANTPWGPGRFALPTESGMRTNAVRISATGDGVVVEHMTREPGRRAPCRGAVRGAPARCQHGSTVTPVNHRRSATAAQIRARLAGASIRAASSVATSARERDASPWAMLRIFCRVAPQSRSRPRRAWRHGSSPRQAGARRRHCCRCTYRRRSCRPRIRRAR